LNLSILHTEVQQFITDHINSDITKLVLKGSPFDGISMQELANQIVAKKKASTKLPTWFSADNIYYPEKISIEQTSSEITSAYKSGLISGETMVDITGGFGVDSYYFSKHFTEVIHLEINPALSAIVKHNYKQLKRENIATFSDNGIDFLKKTVQLFDCIFIDPSRRNDLKGKVFLLKDCLPNVPENIDFLFRKTNKILLKVSPILDISSALDDLQFVKEIHVVAVQNEVKEVLFILEKDFNEKLLIKTINILKKGIQKFDFKLHEEAHSNYSEPLSYLYEPNAAILKSGGFHQISNQLNVFKLHQHSHLYTSDTLVDFPGRVFKIEDVISYDKKKINRLIPGKKANITTRNFPKTVAQIRKETKLKEGGNVFVFFSTDKNNRLIVLVCSKIKQP
jgi:hypothetical protein